MPKIYSRNTWLDRIISGALRYNILDNVGSTLYSQIQIIVNNTITQAGSALTATWMNNIESGVDGLDTLLDGGTGWSPSSATWSYSSADAPTFVISINADVTGIIGVGDRIKLTQTTAKYFIVTAVGTFSAGATLVTVYGGTDYTLANAAITTPFYSHAKSPFSFPMSPAKWTVTATDTTTRTQASPTQNVWYNLNAAHTIIIPIGVWRVRYKAIIDVTSNAAQTATAVYGTLSTSNNSESDNTTSTLVLNVGASASLEASGLAVLNKLYTLTTKTQYYFNVKTSLANQASVATLNTLVPLLIEAECIYL